MNKTIKLIALASCTGAIAFFGYKVYKEVKRVKAEYSPSKQMYKESSGMGDAVATGLSLRVDKAILDEAAKVVEFEAMSYDEIEAEELYVEGQTNYVDEESAVEELKYDPNSVEALMQYRNMLCSDLNHLGQNKTILMKLLDIHIEFVGKEDHILAEKLIEERREFFGDSRWVHDVSIGDLVYHYAKLADFDVDGGVDMWFSQFVYNMEITPGIGNVTLEQKMNRLETHTLTTSVGYGLFGLDKDQFNRSINEGPVSLGKTRASFSRQYNVFIEDMVEQMALEAE